MSDIDKRIENTTIYTTLTPADFHGFQTFIMTDGKKVMFIPDRFRVSKIGDYDVLIEAES